MAEPFHQTLSGGAADGTVCEDGCMTLPSAWVMRFLPLVRSGGRVLDVACGECRHTALLLLKGFQVLAVDADASHARSLLGAPGLAVEQRDLEGDPWPYDGQGFDAVIVTNYLHREHFPHYWASLAPGGVFIMETFTKANAAIWGRPRSPAHYLLPGELLQLMPAGARLAAYEEGLTTERHAVARIVWMKPEASGEPRFRCGVPLGAR